MYCRILILFLNDIGTPIKMMVNNNQMVTAYGDGIHHAVTEKEVTFMIDTKDMQGDLKVAVDGKKI